MIQLNESVATEVRVPIYGAMVTVNIDGDIYSYVPIISWEPGVTLLVQSEVVTAYPDLSQYVFNPSPPPQDPGPNGLWLRAPDKLVLYLAAPPRPIQWTLFYEVTE